MVSLDQAGKVVSQFLSPQLILQSECSFQTALFQGRADIFQKTSICFSNTNQGSSWTDKQFFITSLLCKWIIALHLQVNHQISVSVELFLQPEELRWLSWMFKSSWSSLSTLERFVSILVTRISQSPCYVTQLSATDSSRSLYISSALLGKILKITFGIRLSCPSLPCCEGNELKEVVSCAEGLLWADLAPGGRTNPKALSGSFIYTGPFNSPDFSGQQGSLPACLHWLQHYTGKKQSCLCCQSRRRKKGESAGKERTHLESIGEHWMPWKELQSWQKP